MKKKLLSKVICCAVAALTITSTGMVYASANDCQDTVFGFKMYFNQLAHSETRAKQDNSQGYLNCHNEDDWWDACFCGYLNGSDASYEDSDWQTIKTTNYGYRFTYFYSYQKCTNVFVRGRNYGDHYQLEADGVWSPDSI